MFFNYLKKILFVFIFVLMLKLSLSANSQISITSHIMKSGKIFTIITKPHLFNIEIEIKTKGFILDRSFYFKADKLVHIFIQDLNNDGFEEIYLLIKQTRKQQTIMDIIGLNEYGQTIAKQIKISHHKDFAKIHNNEFLIQDGKLINTVVIGNIKYKYNYILVIKNKEYFLQPLQPKE